MWRKADEEDEHQKQRCLEADEPADVRNWRCSRVEAEAAVT